MFGLPDRVHQAHIRRHLHCLKAIMLGARHHQSDFDVAWEMGVDPFRSSAERGQQS